MQQTRAETGIQVIKRENCSADKSAKIGLYLMATKLSHLTALDIKSGVERWQSVKEAYPSTFRLGMEYCSRLN